MTWKMYRVSLLAGAALLLPIQQLPAQESESAPAPGTPPAPAAEAEPSDATAAPVDDEYGGDEEEIVVTGTRARGSVVGDIPPENILDSRDVRATGATSITELLDALAPQIGSARGRGSGAPVTLLNGQRVSSFREMRDIPPEAIQRV